MREDISGETREVTLFVLEPFVFGFSFLVAACLADQTHTIVSMSKCTLMCIRA